MLVTIDESLKNKCPRVALGCITAVVEAPPAPSELTALMNKRVDEILELPFARGVLESPEITATRAAYKALGKDPARYRGSAEALLRRIVAGKGLPQINAVVDIIESSLRRKPPLDRPIRSSKRKRRHHIPRRPRRRNLQRHRQVRLES